MNISCVCDSRIGVGRPVAAGAQRVGRL